MKEFIKTVKEMRELQKLCAKGLCTKSAIERKEGIVDSMIKQLEKKDVKQMDFGE